MERSRRGGEHSIPLLKVAAPKPAGGLVLRVLEDGTPRPRSDGSGSAPLGPWQPRGQGSDEWLLRSWASPGDGSCSEGLQRPAVAAIVGWVVGAGGGAGAGGTQRATLAWGGMNGCAQLLVLILRRERCRLLLPYLHVVVSMNCEFGENVTKEPLSPISLFSPLSSPSLSLCDLKPRAGVLSFQSQCVALGPSPSQQGQGFRAAWRRLSLGRP